MKLSIFLFLLTFMQVFAIDSYSQKTKLSLDMNNATVEDVLNKIENQSEFFFLFSPKIVDVTRKVNIKLEGNKIDDALNQLFNGTEIAYLVIDRQIVLSTHEQMVPFITTIQQEITITGKVTDEDGNPLPGVNIVIKGTLTGTITNVDGDYTLKVDDPEAVLVFTFIGMLTQEIKIGDQTEINITMARDVIGLEEVVAIGYGTQRKVTVTGAITTLGSEEIISSPVTKLTDGLAGKLSGVIINQRGGEPGRTNTEIFIRGKSTTEDTRVLYVIDGIVRDYEGLDRLDPNEIESITVLKDASAAIYGSRAANGVILITTKRGRVGKATLEFTHNHGISQPTRLPRTASSGQYAEACNLRNEFLGLVPRYTKEEVKKFYDGSDPYRYPNTDWYDLVYKEWKSQDKANLSVTGGTENVRYFISGGYLQQGSPYDQSYTYNKQYNFRSNIDATINDRLTVSLDVAGRQNDILSTEIDYWHVVLGYPYNLPINPNGSYGEGRTGENAIAMVRERDYGYTSTDRGVLSSSLSAVWNLPWIEGLSLSGTFAYDYNKTYDKEGADVWYYYSYNPDDDTYTKRQGSRTATPNLDVSNEQGTSITANARLGFARSFGQNNVDAFIAYEQNTTHTDNLSAGRSSFLSFAIEELFAGTADKNLQSSNGSANNTARQHVFGRIAYDYARRYMLQFQLRYDGSQNFPADNRWGLFPGVSAGWAISEESFMDGIAPISFLKLRGSWGQMGNDRVAAYQYLTSYSYSRSAPQMWGPPRITPVTATFGGVTLQGLAQSGVPNPNITWEVATTTDIGLEARFWGQLLGIDIDLFKTRRDNILATRDVSVPDYTGLELPDENIGVVDNKGIEVMVTHRSNIGDLKYFISGNFTYVKNEVIDIDEVPMAEPYQDATGHPIGAGLLYEVIGIFDDDADVDSYPTLAGTTPGHLIRKDMNGDMQINSLDQVRQDLTTTPQIIYGLNTSFSYKGFDLSLNWQGQAKAIISPFQPFNFDPVQWGNFNPWLVEDGWRPDNPTGTKPRPGLDRSQGTSGTTFHWMSGAFVRLKNAELAYNLPQSVISRIGVTGARVYVSGYNLLSIDELKDISVDPEQTGQNTTPPERIVNIGISLTF